MSTAKERLLAAIALFLLTHMGTSAQAQKASPQANHQQDVFVSGTEGYDTFRIPALAVTNRGTILAFCEGRKSGRSDTGNIDMLLKRSTDNGKTWQAMQTVWDDGQNVCGNPCPVVDRKTGTVCLLMTHNLGEDSEGRIWDSTGRGSRTVWISRSTDDGLTWSKPNDITGTTKETDWTWYATGPGKGIQLRHGARKGRLVVPCDHGVAGGRDYHSHVIYSDDGGATWKVGGSVPDKTTSECEVVELDDGSLLINIRNHFRKTFRRTIARSGDGGLSWSDVWLDEALLDPHCQASVLSYSGMFAPPQAPHQTSILFSNPAAKDRTNMTVRLSGDGAKTWPVSLRVHAGPSAYSCLAVLPDGSVGCLYERGDKHAYEKITLARLRVTGTDKPGLEWVQPSLRVRK